jgi:hypothetical protein
MSTCRSCGAKIIFVKTRPSKRSPNGGHMPLDAEPGPKGNVLITPDGFAEVHKGPVRGGRMAHHATCPQREDWKATARAERATQ